jgi:hypothetical protein
MVSLMAREEKETDETLTCVFIYRTDSNNDPIPSKASFDLPDPTTTISTQGEDRVVTVKEWRWVEPDWWVDMKGLKEGLIDEDGWQYSNNAWKGATGKGGLKQFTRRRKWCRNAKLIETATIKQSGERTDRKRINSKDEAN